MSGRLETADKRTIATAMDTPPVCGQYQLILLQTTDKLPAMTNLVRLPLLLRSVTAKVR